MGVVADTRYEIRDILAGGWQASSTTVIAGRRRGNPFSFTACQKGEAGSHAIRIDRKSDDKKYLVSGILDLVH